MTTVAKTNVFPKAVECFVTCFEDGSISIEDKWGTELNGMEEQEFFLSCHCKEISEIQQGIVDIKIVEHDGTLCKVKKIGNMVYKIPCEQASVGCVER